MFNLIIPLSKIKLHQVTFVRDIKRLRFIFKISKIADKKLFSCQYGHCDYQSTQCAQVLTHKWGKHQLDRNFIYTCGISSCTSSYNNLKSSVGMLKSKILVFLTSIWSSFKNKSVFSYDGKEVLYGNGEEGQQASWQWR